MPPLCYTVLEEKRFDEAKSVAEKRLRSFPNSYKAVEKTSNFYSDAFLFTQNRANMERAIELTQRLFALVEDPTGATRFELLSRMANHYELLNDWEAAKKYDPLAMTLYYELAFLQEKQGRSAEAQENIRTAVRIARDGGPGAAQDFLTDERVHISAEDQGKSGVELILLLTQTRGSKALVAAAREEAGQER